MNVYFLRHAEAESSPNADFDRALTIEGRKQAERVGAFFNQRHWMPDLILTSPVIRAYQTAELMAQVLNLSSKVLQEPWLACGMSPQKCWAGIQAYKQFQNIVLVGHEPDLSTSIAQALGGDVSSSLRLKKAAVAKLHFEHMHVFAAWLEFLIPVECM